MIESTFLLLLLSNVEFSCAETFQLPCHWQVGEQWDVELIKTREKWKGDVSNTLGKTQTPICLEVLSKSDDGFLLSWTFEKTQFLEGIEKDGGDEIAARMADLTAGLRLELRTGPEGALLDLSNVDEALAAYAKSIDTLQQWMTEQGLPEETIRALLKALEPLRSKESASVMLLREPALLLALYGMSFETGKKLEYEDQLPNPFGGELLPSHAWFLLEEWNTETHTARINWGQTVDGEKAKDILLASFQKIARQSGLPDPQREDVPKFQIEDLARFNVDTETGWPHTLQHTRMVVSGSDHSLDRMEFRVTRKPSRAPKR